MTLDQYIDNINKRYKLGNATEHTFRGDLQQLLESLVPDIRATNEPKRQSCGAPDYILTKKEIPVGFIEAKDIGDKDLEGTKKTGNKEQFDRYKASLNNLIFTDYVDFHLYIDGIFITKIAIAEIHPDGKSGRTIVPLPNNFATFTNLIKDFGSHVGQTIKSSKKLAEMMAGKARLLSDVIEKALTSDETNREDSTLKDQMNAFKQILIHDITAKGFADVYAQTIAYGMFAARLHDPTLPTFSRQEAAELIPKSNPFLRKLFGYIAGPDLDDRIKWIVDSLVEIFLACNVEEILKNYGKSTKMEDPIIHFYETFLSEYDPKLRKARGVWYTPAPVVNFIVRAVDDILKTEFDLPQGLADTSKTKIKVHSQGQNKTIEQEVHKVQILDPATGTGTFLAETIKHIHKKFEGQQGIWSNYVETHLLPRLNGFELLMASYAMAHLKLDLLLTETGFKPTTNQRFRVYLTNSLEESHPDTGTLFANWLSTEANEANHIKRDTPVMCVIGNPPYAVSSTNKNEWIDNLMLDYKKGLDDNNIQPLSDDYLKFIRYGQFIIEKNGEGVLAYISNNSFLDSVIHRQMRRKLLETFDKIYILDLHGSTKKNETTLKGDKDENVFDIQQGVSINLFIKNNKNKCGVLKHDLFGNRENKYDFLLNNSLSTIEWIKLMPEAERYYFKKVDSATNLIYQKYISLNSLFIQCGAGVQTKRDNVFVDIDKNKLTNRINSIINKTISDLDSRNLNIKNSSSYKLLEKINCAKFEAQLIKAYNYRVFDDRLIYYDKNLLGRAFFNTMQHMLRDNVSLLTCKQQSSFDFQHSFVTKQLTDHNSISLQTSEATHAFPLYLYPETNAQQTIGQTTERTPNLNAEIVKQIAEKLGIPFEAEKSAPLNLPKGETSKPNLNLPKGETLKPHQDLPKEETFGTREVKLPGYLTANARSYRFTKEFQEELKKNPTDAEKVMWELLRNKKTDHKIRRQHIIDDFITDFVCLRKNLVIEIDGKIHLQQKEYDELRTARLNELGYEVIRFTNDEVFENAELVATKIKQKLDSIEGINAPLNLPKGETTGANSSPPLEGSGEAFAPIDILDYIYAILHSPTYREKYKEFLKIDFPRVPYPKDKDTFWKLAKLGGEIRQIHLFENLPKVFGIEKYITQYPIDGNNVVTKPKYQDGKVYINDTQYFDNVPQVAWDFYIGGYQPAQKWLKDRKERTLEFDDILHYQKIIVALSETDRLMNEINKIKIE